MRLCRCPFDLSLHEIFSGSGPRPARAAPPRLVAKLLALWMRSLAALLGHAFLSSSIVSNSRAAGQIRSSGSGKLAFLHRLETDGHLRLPASCSPAATWCEDAGSPPPLIR